MFGNARTVGGDAFRVLLLGTKAIKPTVTDLTTGEYAVNYTAQLAGAPPIPSASPSLSPSPSLS